MPFSLRIICIILSPLALYMISLSEVLRWACEICIALGDSKMGDLFATANVDEEVLNILYKLKSKLLI